MTKSVQRFFAKKLDAELFWSPNRWNWDNKEKNWASFPRLYKTRGALINSMKPLFIDHPYTVRVAVMGGYDYKRIPRTDTVEEMMKRENVGIFVIDLIKDIKEAEQIL